MRPNYYEVQRREKASYETNAAKNKEINILSRKKDEHLKVEVGIHRQYIVESSYSTRRVRKKMKQMGKNYEK